MAQSFPKKFRVLMWMFSDNEIIFQSFQEKMLFLSSVCLVNRHKKLKFQPHLVYYNLDGAHNEKNFPFFEHKPSVKESAWCMGLFDARGFCNSDGCDGVESPAMRDVGIFIDFPNFSSFLCKKSIVAPFNKYEDRKMARDEF